MSGPRDQLPIVVDGYHYSINWRGFRRKVVAAMREMVDQGIEAGDYSFSNVGIFKRTGEDFVFGSGQVWWDTIEESNRRRFHTSQHVDPWERRRLTLLHRVLALVPDPLVGEDFNTFVTQPVLISAGGYLYAFGQRGEERWPVGFATGFGDESGPPDYSAYGTVDEFTLYRWDPVTETWDAPWDDYFDELFDPANFDPLNGLGELLALLYHQSIVGAQAVDATTDGTTVWSLHRPPPANALSLDDWFVLPTVNGTLIDNGAGSVTSGFLADTDAIIEGGVIEFANGRLFVAVGNLIFDVAANLTETLHYTHWSDQWVWTTVAHSPGGTYIAGGDSEVSEIYIIGVDDVGALTAPVVAATMPGGETVTAMVHYGGVMVIGTDKGARVAAISSDGSLTYGPLIEVATPVTSLHGQGEFVWVGGGNNPAGLSRLNLARFVDDLVPAYATDLTPVDDLAVDLTETNFVVGIDGADGERLLAFSGDNLGIFLESDTDYASDGTITTGRITFGTPERKRFTSIEVVVEIPEDIIDLADVEVWAQTPGVEWVLIGTCEDGINKFSFPATFVDEWVEIELRPILRSNTLLTPAVIRWTLRALPLPYRVEEIHLPLQLHSQVEAPGGAGVGLNPFVEWSRLKALVDGRRIVEVTIGDETLQCYADDLAIAGQDDATPLVGWTDDGSWIDATWILKLITVEGSA